MRREGRYRLRFRRRGEPQRCSCRNPQNREPVVRPAPAVAASGVRHTPVAASEARDDRELMRAVVTGDVSAFDAIYGRHAQPVYGLAYRILRERCAAEDVAQEAFVALWRSRHSYRPERGSPGSWLLTITHNRAIDAIRRGRAHLHVELDSERDDEAPECTEDEALRRLQAATVGSALRTLPEAQRQAVVLGYYGGFSHTEIAARLGVPPGTVKSRMRLALRRLAGQLDPPAGALHQALTEPAGSRVALG
jgi:RNA polymerase sigma-70 factor (ECF subfamily)